MAAPAIPAAVPAATRRSQGLWRDALRRLRRNKPAMLGVLLIVLFVATAVFAPWLAPFDPLEGELINRLKPPSSVHPMGTDLQGRDELSRVIYGARVSLVAGLASVAMGIGIGGTIGALAGGLGGKVDAVLMRVVDVMLSIPGILLAIGLIAWLDRGLLQIMRTRQLDEAIT